MKLRNAICEYRYEKKYYRAFFFAKFSRRYYLQKKKCLSVQDCKCSPRPRNAVPSDIVAIVPAPVAHSP